MERIRTNRFAAEVARGLSFVPVALLERAGTIHFWEGNIYLEGGIYDRHPQGGNLETYRLHYPDDDHYASAFSPLHLRYRPADDRCSTVCFTGRGGRYPCPPATVVHEVGHCLLYSLDSYENWPWPFRSLAGLPCLPIISSYSSDSYTEQFCDALVAWLLPRSQLWGRHAPGPERLWEGGRRWLAVMNGMAGLPSDLPPRALR